MLSSLPLLLSKERLARNRTSLDGYRPYTWLLEEPTLQSMVIETTASFKWEEVRENLLKLALRRDLTFDFNAIAVRYIANERPD